MRFRNCIIFLNGDLPLYKVARNYIKKDTFILAADGGSNNISIYKITPNAVVGDMDSIKPSILKELQKNNVEILEIKEQETTDFEKCLLYCIKYDFEKIFVFGGASPRADHTLNNYSIMKRYHKKLNLIMVDNIFEISFINNIIKFNYKKGELVSLLPFPKASKVKTNGLRYKLDFEDLEFGEREGTLNESTALQVSISFDKGSLVLFKKHFL